MPASPEAGSVVERLRAYDNFRTFEVLQRSDGPVGVYTDITEDVRALLAVVEAAQKVQEARDLVLPQHFKAWLGVLDAEAEALAALYAPDSAEERE